MRNIDYKKRIEILRKIDILLENNEHKDNSWVDCICDNCIELKEKGFKLLSLLPKSPNKCVKGSWDIGNTRGSKLTIEMYTTQRPNFGTDAEFAKHIGMTSVGISVWKKRNREELERLGFKPRLTWKHTKKRSPKKYIRQPNNMTVERYLKERPLYETDLQYCKAINMNHRTLSRWKVRYKEELEGAGFEVRKGKPKKAANKSIKKD